MDFTRCAILIVAARFRGAGTMPLARPSIGRAARAGGADWPARKSAFDSATSRYPQYPAEPRTGKYFVRRVHTFEALSYHEPRARTWPSSRFISLFTFPPYIVPRARRSPNFGRETYKYVTRVNRRHPRPPPIGLVASAGEDGSPFKRVVPSLSHASRIPSFLPSSRSIGERRFTCCGCVLCERALCVPWILVLFSVLLLIFTDFSTSCPHESPRADAEQATLLVSYTFGLYTICDFFSIN